MILAPLHRGAAEKDFAVTIEMVGSFNEVKNLITKAPIFLADYLSRNPVCAVTRSTIPLKVWKSETKNDEELQNGFGGRKRFKKNLFEEEGIVNLKRNSTKIAVSSSLTERVIKYYHEQYRVHGRSSRIIHLIIRLFVWSNSIREFFNNCKKCVATKIKRPNRWRTKSY